jgi:PPOX class probable FMN-dependent enzyme
MHTLPFWRDSLHTQLEHHAHLPHSRFVQVATIREDGRPANRTLTFRFFLQDGRLLFTADTRTEKTTQLAANPWAEACWYFTESRVQVRLLGTMRLVAETTDEELQQARLQTWKERSDESRQSFTWPHAGQPLSALERFSKAVPEMPPENFALLILAPERADILDLAQAPHSRVIHQLADGMWTAEAVNP